MNQKFCMTLISPQNEVEFDFVVIQIFNYFIQISVRSFLKLILPKRKEISIEKLIYSVFFRFTTFGLEMFERLGEELKIQVEMAEARFEKILGRGDEFDGFGTDFKTIFEQKR